MEKLSEDTDAYMEWKNKKPDVADLFHMFPSVRIPAASLVIFLNWMKLHTCLMFFFINR